MVCSSKMAAVVLVVMACLGSVVQGVRLGADQAQASVNKEARGGDLTAFAEKACPEQVGRCKMDNECAQEVGGLIGGAQPISAAAQVLVQCVSSNMARNRLQLRSKQSVKQEAFGSVLQSKLEKATKTFLGRQCVIKNPLMKLMKS
jgi:hypothetical protein